MAKYTIDQINIGDEISYEDRYQSSHSVQWKVLQKLDKSLLLIEINDNGQKSTKIIDVLDVKDLFLSEKNKIYSPPSNKKAIP